MLARANMMYADEEVKKQSELQVESSVPATSVRPSKKRKGTFALYSHIKSNSKDDSQLSPRGDDKGTRIKRWQFAKDPVIQYEPTHMTLQVGKTCIKKKGKQAIKAIVNFDEETLLPNS